MECLKSKKKSGGSGSSSIAGDSAQLEAAEAEAESEGTDLSTIEPAAPDEQVNTPAMPAAL